MILMFMVGRFWHVWMLMLTRCFRRNFETLTYELGDQSSILDMFHHWVSGCEMKEGGGRREGGEGKEGGGGREGGRGWKERRVGGGFLVRDDAYA